MKKGKIDIWLNSEEGNTITLVVVLLLCMTLLAAASVTLARTQWTMARFSRQTSNSYYLARSGAEKIVDSMNKEIATELPRLMEQASNTTLSKMLGDTSTDDGISYDTSSDGYSGKYIGREHNNEYEVKLKELIYAHMKDNFNGSISYKAYSDVKGNEPIEITTKMYHKASAGVPADLQDMVNNLVEESDIGTVDGDAFVVEVTARAKKDSKTSLTKSRVVGTIALSQLVSNNEELLEEYTWAVDEHGKGIYPEALQSAVISFGDFIIQGDYKATIDGDIHVKGTQRKINVTEYISGDFPEPDEWGGITVSDGGELKVKGSAFVVSNIQTANSYGKEDEGAEIIIEEDAIANTIAIHDSYYIGHPTNTTPWNPNHYVEGNEISIGRNAYMDNDIRIDRYVDEGKIKVTGSVFGISDRDTNGMIVGGKTIVDPNKSSGVFSLGKDSIITMGRAFVAGQPFINFGDGNGYHRLHESIGEPFEDVYYLDEYREEYNDNHQYITDFSDLVKKGKIKIENKSGNKPYGYAPAYVSATIVGETSGQSYDIKTGTAPITDQAKALEMFYLGSGTLGSFPVGWENKLAQNSDWDKPILGTDHHWASVINNPFNYYNGENSFNKVFIPDGTSFVYDNMLGYKGLQGYMLAKRGVFYGKFKEITGITKYEPEQQGFEDLVDISVFTDAHKWSYNNPIHIVTNDPSKTDKTIEIDISEFDSMPTAIVCNDKELIIKLKASNSAKAVFNGVIITPGKVEIISNMQINGVIIAGNECTAITPTREDIQGGKYAGVQISASNVEIKYDRDMILKIRFMDKSLQRKLYDCLKITNYKSSAATSGAQDRINTIMGPEDKRKIKLSPSSVISSKQGGLQFVMKSLRKL